MKLARFQVYDTGQTSSVTVSSSALVLPCTYVSVNSYMFDMVFTCELVNFSTAKQALEMHYQIFVKGVLKAAFLLILEAYSSSQYRYCFRIYNYQGSTYIYQSSWYIANLGDFKFMRMYFDVIRIGTTQFDTHYQVAVYDDEYCYNLVAQSTVTYIGITGSGFGDSDVTLKIFVDFRYAQLATGDKIVFLIGPFVQIVAPFAKQGCTDYFNWTNIDKVIDVSAWGIPLISYTPSQIYALDYRSEMEDLQNDLNVANNKILDLESQIAALNDLSSTDVSSALASGNWAAWVNSVIMGTNGPTLLGLVDNYLNNAGFGLPATKDFLDEVLDTAIAALFPGLSLAQVLKAIYDLVYEVKILANDNNILLNSIVSSLAVVDSKVDAIQDVLNSVYLYLQTYLFPLFDLFINLSPLMINLLLQALWSNLWAGFDIKLGWPPNFVNENYSVGQFVQDIINNIFENDLNIILPKTKLLFTSSGISTSWPDPPKKCTIVILGFNIPCYLLPYIMIPIPAWIADRIVPGSENWDYGVSKPNSSLFEVLYDISLIIGALVVVYLVFTYAPSAIGPIITVISSAFHSVLARRKWNHLFDLLSILINEVGATDVDPVTLNDKVQDILKRRASPYF